MLTKIVEEKRWNIKNVNSERTGSWREIENSDNDFDEITDVGNEINDTFCNPHVGFPCENCEFNAKSYAGLKVHVKAKHKENFEVEVELTGNTEPELVAAVEKSVDENTFKCEECDFVSDKEENLNIHITSIHKVVQSLEKNKTELEVFAIVFFGNDVFKTRQNVLDKLNEQKEVETVLKLYIDK